MFRASKNRRDSAPVPVPVQVSSMAPKWLEYRTKNWKSTLKRFKKGLFWRKESPEPAHVQLNSHLKSPIARQSSLEQQSSYSRTQPRRHRQLSWLTGDSRSLDVKGPPVPPKDFSEPPNPTSFLRRAILRSRNPSQSVAYGTPIIVEIRHPKRHSQYETPTVFSTQPYEPEGTRTETHSSSQCSLPRKPVSPSAHPKFGVSKLKIKNDQVAQSVKPERPRSTAYIPTHASKDFSNMNFVQDLGNEAGLRQYAKQCIPLQEPLSNHLFTSPLPSPGNDYQTFLETSQKVARRISSTQWDREQPDSGVWGVIGDITRVAPSPVVSRERPPSRPSAVRPPSRGGRPLSRAGSIIERVGEYIKPTRPESVYSQSMRYRDDKSSIGGVEKEIEGGEKRWSISGSIRRSYSKDRERQRLERRKGGSEPPTAMGLQKFNRFLASGY